MRHVLLFLLVCFLLTACDIREREQELNKKLAEINRREQELIVKEKTLQLREDELNEKVKRLDSSSKSPADSFFVSHPQVRGRWNVTMRCTETNCSGSAVGDIKIEQWEIRYQDNGIIANAYSDNKLVRVYSGTSNGTAIELSTQPENGDANSTTKMIVRIQEIKEKEMTGQRDIIRPDNCHIVYSLDFKKA
jgi:hypothetical protein